MNQHLLRSVLPGLALLLSLALSGCLQLGTGRGEPTRYFTLEAAATEVHPELSGAKETLLVGIGPLRLASYLDRPQLITRKSAHELHLAETAHWAEPLAENIQRTLAANLANLTGGAQTLNYPWRSSQPPTHQISLHILQFDSGPDEQAHLRVSWTLRTIKGGHPEVSRLSSFSTPLSDNSHAQQVAALSALLAEFSGELAQELASALRAQHDPSQPLVK